MHIKKKIITALLILSLMLSGCSAGNNSEGQGNVEYTERNLDGEGSTGIILSDDKDTTVTTPSADNPNTPALTDNAIRNDSSPTVQEMPETPEISYSAQTIEFKKKDTQTDFNLNDCAVLFFENEQITLSGNTGLCSSVIIDEASSTATITSAGDYYLSGESTNGQIYINAGKKDDVRLILDGLTISNENNAPIHAESCDKLILTLVDGSVNTISDTMAMDTEDTASSETEQTADDALSSASDSTIFSRGTIAINGNGQLTVNSQNCQGIHSTDSIKIISGNIEITSGSHGIKGKDAVIIKSPSLKLTCGGDGIKATNTAEDKGFVTILDGILEINAVMDGISAENSIELLGGVQKITCNGGSVNGANRSGYGFNGDGFMDWWKASNQEDTTYSAKGIKSNTTVFINGSETEIDASDDTIHSHESIIMDGGKLTLSSGDDGMHAEKNIAINGGNITIKTCYEGIEAATICINGGDSVIYANDDGINASAGSSESDDGFSFDGNTPPEGFSNGDFTFDGKMPPEDFNNGGFTFDGKMPPEDFSNGDFTFDGKTPPSKPADGDFSFDNMTPQKDSQGNRNNAGGGMANPFASDSSVIYINGGSIYINAAGDGIDSNGDVYMTGGTVMVDGPVNDANSAFDHNGTALISGGTIVASGSSGMIENFSSSSMQNVILVYFDKTLDADRKITVTDSTGTDILSFTNAKSTSCAIISTPAFKSGETYSFSVDGVQFCDITVSDTLSSNGSLSEGFGGFGGFGGPGGFNGGRR